MLNSVSLVIRSLGVVYVVGFFHPVYDTTPFFICICDALRDFFNHLYNFKNVKNIYGVVLLLVKLQRVSFDYRLSEINQHCGLSTKHNEIIVCIYLSKFVTASIS